MNRNKVEIAGKLTRDPELRYTTKGTPAAKIGVAINRKWKGEDGEEKEEVCFVDVDAWGRQAEVVAQYFKKGSPIFIDGRLKLDSWEDKNTHQKVYKLKVVLESFSFIGGKSDGQRQAQSERPAGAPIEPPDSLNDAPTNEPDSEVPF